MTRQTSLVISTITSDNIQDFRAANDVVVIGFLAAEDRKSHDLFTILAMDLRDNFLFGVTSDETLAETEQIKTPSIVVYKTFEEEKNVLELSDDSNVMIALVKTASRPLIVEFRPELHDGYFDVS